MVRSHMGVAALATSAWLAAGCLRKAPAPIGGRHVEPGLQGDRGGGYCGRACRAVGGRRCGEHGPGECHQRRCSGGRAERDWQCRDLWLRPVRRVRIQRGARSGRHERRHRHLSPGPGLADHDPGECHIERRSARRFEWCAGRDRSRRPLDRVRELRSDLGDLPMRSGSALRHGYGTDSTRRVSASTLPTLRSPGAGGSSRRITGRSTARESSALTCGRAGPRVGIGAPGASGDDHAVLAGMSASGRFVLFTHSFSMVRRLTFECSCATWLSGGRDW